MAYNAEWKSVCESEGTKNHRLVTTSFWNQTSKELLESPKTVLEGGLESEVMTEINWLENFKPLFMFADKYHVTKVIRRAKT